jgi:hypothetical protein
VGLPTTHVALILPLVFLTIFAGRSWYETSLRVAVALCALAMVSGVRVRKPGGAAYAFFLLLAIIVAGVLVWTAPRLHAEWPK